MLHQHGVQLAARATNRSQARWPRISPCSSRIQETFLDQRRELARAQAALSRAERRFLPRWPKGDDGRVEAAGLLPNAAAKVGDGGSSVSRALAVQDDEAPVAS